jgi:hypothetical protein
MLKMCFLYQFLSVSLRVFIVLKDIIDANLVVLFPKFFRIFIVDFSNFFSLVFPLPTSHPTLCWWISHKLPINTHEYLGLLLSQST